MRNKTGALLGALLAGLSIAAFSTPAAAVDLEAMKAHVADHQKLPEFQAPGEPFDARACMKDKKLIVVPFSSSVEFTGGVASRMVEIAKDIGFQYDHYRTQGQPSQWIQGINQGISQKYDLIDVLMPDPRALVPQGMQAKEAGIPIVAAHAAGLDTKPPEPFLMVPIDYTQAGQLMAEWVVTKTEGKANVLFLTAKDSFSAESVMSGVLPTLEQCEDCKVKQQNVNVVDWGTRLQPTVQAELLRDPSIDYIIVMYDGMAQFVVPAVELTQSKAKIVTFNGSPFVLDLVQQGRVEMDIGESIDWVAHAILDAEMRILCGLPHVTDPKAPLYIFDASNVDTAGTPPQVSTGYGDAYVEGYRKLWGLQ
ncbi:sugar ABC transporter substrate-binding protein [Pseudaminobacter sp. 19-2017]|uniref:Sugar ABC transporter substrate-binding protein n=1 Tax=Pseudaminobacter soli (ex Zhang et al. 2022) TaxID=2831468 RepID=A0A942I3B7_9HYPH|nr:sugar ABC transporter substrate-binding protein [Pseudaminobacter soli]MBS3651032.1 sugar ABC transporter substrate-binding protein [Pseudaminobacter soli]